MRDVIVTSGSVTSPAVLIALAITKSVMSSKRCMSSNPSLKVWWTVIMNPVIRSGEGSVVLFLI